MPPHPPGTISIEVTNEDGLATRLENALPLSNRHQS